jgi:hypothetical protein
MLITLSRPENTHALVLSEVLPSIILFLQNVLTLCYSFAWAEMRMLAANFLTRFDLEEVPGQEVDCRQFITMQFKTGSWKVMVKPRFEII